MLRMEIVLHGRVICVDLKLVASPKVTQNTLCPVLQGQKGYAKLLGEKEMATKKQCDSR